MSICLYVDACMHPRDEKKPKDARKEERLTMVVGKDAAQTPSRLSVRSSTPDATTYKGIECHIHISHS